MLTRGPISAAKAQSLLPHVFDKAPTKLAVAASGGADSFALLWLMRQLRPPQDLLALTVDHGLRRESTEEAKVVSEWCRKNNIRHRTLSWDGPKPATGIQAAARTARYRLLAEACEAEKVSWLLSAHNADDQAETVFARLARGSGPVGLGGMRTLSRIAAGPGDPVTLFRPLLDVPRAALRATANEQNLPFRDDPSNDDMSFDRVRHRAFLAAIESQELLDKQALLRMSARMRRAAELSDAALAKDFNSARGLFHGTGAIRFGSEAIAQLSPPAQLRLLSRAIEAVSGGAYPPDLENLFDETEALPASYTLGGALMRRTKEAYWIMREPAAVLGRADTGTVRYEVAVSARQKVLWDHRVIVKIPDEVPKDAVLAPIGEGATGPEAARMLVSSLPGLWHGTSLIAVPDYAKKMLPPAAVPWKQAASALDINLLTDERFNHRVIRF